MKFNHVITSALVFSLVATTGAQAFGATAQPVINISAEVSVPICTISDSTLYATTESITGVLPQFSGIRDTAFQTKLNKIISDLYNSKMQEAKKDPNGEINFSYEVINSGKYVSVLVYTSVSYGNTGSDEVTTIVLDNAKYKVYDTLVDVLGPNGYKIANKVISKSNPEGFKGTNNATKFFVDKNGDIVVIFNKYEIADGASSTPKFVIPSKEMVEMTIPFSETYFSGETRMVALKSIADQVGYEVSWNNGTVTLKKGDEVHRLTIGVKAVENNRELEVAPKIINGRTYVPISYLETVLGGMYTAEANSYTLNFFKVNSDTSEKITQGDFAIMLIKSLSATTGVDLNANGKSDSLLAVVKAGKDLGILPNDENGKFNTNDLLTNQDMALMVYNAMNKLNMLPNGAAKDSSANAIAVLTQIGLINGNDGTFDPSGTITEDTAKTLIQNILKVKINK